MFMGHHLSDADLTKLIRNVGRSCRRFILIDLVRHPLPLALFRTFIVPFVSHVTAADGMASVRRAYTPVELERIASDATAAIGARFRHTVAPFYVRQILDISYDQ